MNFNDLVDKFTELKNKYSNIKDKPLISLSKKELKSYIGDTITLIKDCEFIRGEIYAKDYVKKEKDSAKNLDSNCEVLIRHLTPKLSEAELLLNSKIDKLSLQRDILLLSFSILLSVIISIFLPTVQTYFGQNQSIKTENALDDIRTILNNNLLINEEILRVLNGLDSNLVKSELFNVNKKPSKMSQSFIKNKAVNDSSFSTSLKLNSKFVK